MTESSRDVLERTHYHTCPKCNERVECVLAVLTEKQVCELLGISQATAWRYRKNRKLRYCKYGTKVLYLPEHVAEFLKTHEVDIRVVADSFHPSLV